MLLTVCESEGSSCGQTATVTSYLMQPECQSEFDSPTMQPGRGEQCTRRCRVQLVWGFRGGAKDFARIGNETYKTNYR